MAGGAGFRIEVFVHMVTVFPGRGEGQREAARRARCRRPHRRLVVTRLTRPTRRAIRSGTMKAMTRITPALLRAHPAFRRFWLGQTVSLMGDQVTLIALPLVAVLELHASAAQMGYLTAAAVLPNLVFSLPAGAAVDRYGHRRQAMIAADVGRGLLLALVPLSAAFGLLSLGELYVIAFLAGSLSVLFMVAYSALFVALVPRDAYVGAMSLLNGSRAFSFVAGPSIGGVLVQVLTAPAAVAVDAASFAVSALCL